MRHPSTLPILAVLCATLLAAAPRMAAAGLPAATRSSWIEVRSPRFTVYSNAGTQAAEQVARHLERLADVMASTTSRFNVDGRRQIHVYLFRDPPSFQPYSPFPDDKDLMTAGFHIPGLNADRIALIDLPDGRALKTAAHEFTHAVIGRSFGHVPVWLNEGLAEYFSTFRVRGREADIGRPIPEHVAWLRSHELSLNYLMHISTESPDYQHGENSSTIYAESWALVHALAMSHEPPPGRFGLLIEDIAGGDASLQAMARVYGPNALDSLETTIREMAVRATLPYFAWKFGDDFKEIPLQTRKLDRPSTLVTLGELLVGTDTSLYPLAERHFRAAWQADSTSSVTAAWLGMLDAVKGKPGAADVWFRVVERRAAAEPLACAIAGEALARLGKPLDEGPRWPAPGSNAASLRGRALLDRALDREPDRSEWLTDYGLTFLDDTTGYQDGIGALITARAEWPWRPDITGALSVLYMRAGDLDRAILLYQQIPAGSNSQTWRSFAGWSIAGEMNDRIQALAKNGRMDEAEAMLRRLRKDVKEPGLSDRLAPLESWLQKRAADSRAVGH